MPYKISGFIFKTTYINLFLKQFRLGVYGSQRAQPLYHKSSIVRAKSKVRIKSQWELVKPMKFLDTKNATRLAQVMIVALGTRNFQRQKRTEPMKCRF